MSDWKNKLDYYKDKSKQLNQELKTETDRIKEELSLIEGEMDRIKKRVLIDEMNDLTDFMNTLFQNPYLEQKYPELSGKIYEVMQDIDHTAVELEEELEEEVNTHYANK